MSALDVPFAPSRAASSFGRLSLTFAALGAGAAVLLALVYLFAVRTRVGQVLDDAALGGLTRAVDLDAYSTVEDVLDTVGVLSLLAATLALTAAAVYRHRFVAALGALVVLLGSTMTTELLKLVLPRPPLAPNRLGPSFPSGHVTAAFAVGVVALMVAPVALRKIVAVGVALYTAGIAIGVVALDWHRPSDVLGALLVVTAWASGALAIIEEAALRRARAIAPAARRADRSGARLPAAVGVAAVGAAIVARESVLVDVIEPSRAFVVAMGASVLVGVLLIALFSSLLGRASLPSWRGRARAWRAPAGSE